MERIGASGVAVVRAACAVVLTCFVCTGTVQAARNLDARGSIQPTASDYFAVPPSYFPRDFHADPVAGETAMLSIQSYPWSATSGSDTVETTSTIGSRVNFGSLGAFASSNALVTHGGYMRGSAEAVASFTDTFIVQATTGHPSQVPINFRLNVHGVGSATTTGSATYFAKLHLSDMNGYPLLLDANSYQGETVTLNQTVSLYVGMQYTLFGELTAKAVATSTVSMWENTPSSSAQMDAWNTSHSFVWSDDPGVTLVTGSGANYSVPEPSGLALVGGVLLVALRRSR